MLRGCLSDSLFSLFFFFFCANKFCCHGKAKQLLTVKPPYHGIAEWEKVGLNVSLDTARRLRVSKEL